MSSSTSSSEPFHTGDPAEWRRFSLRAITIAIALGIALFAFVIALDPYDTGVLALVHKQGTTESGGRIGDASRIHDEAYDSAIFGNSHIMTVVAQRLSAATGLKFMMLGIQGTGVPEQMTMLDTYLRRHSKPKAIVMGVDWVYCLEDPRVHPVVPFPDWLYTANRWSYVTGLLQSHTLEVVGRRVLYLFGRWKPQVRDGEVDIFEGFHHTPDDAAKIINGVPPEDFSHERAMPAFDMLRQRLDRISPDTKVVLVLPPVVAANLPPPGTPADASVQACKQRAFDLAKGRANVRVVDWNRITPETKDFANFWDPSHYYDNLAKLVERDIVAALASLGGSPTGK